MTGWKSWSAGIALIATGVGMIATSIASGNFDMNTILAGVAKIGEGLAVIGIAHKIEKNGNMNTVK